MKKKVLVIIPDRFVKASGGMGENSAPLFEKLSETYDFYVAGFPLAGTEVPKFVTEYHEVGAPFTQVTFGPLNTMIAQSSYLAAAVSFPKPDLIYAFDWSIYLAATYAADLFKVPMIARMCLSPILLSEQGYSFGLDVKDPVQKSMHNAFCEMEIRGLKRADRIVHVSRGYARQYEHVAPTFPTKARFVINGIDLDKWQDKNVEPFVFPGNNKIKMVFLGRLAEMKGIIPLCQARVPEGVDLIFVGDKTKADRVCMNAINDKVAKGKNVFFIGALYGQDKIRALRSADALLVTSYHEPFGGVGLEGLAAGCIVISSRAGGLSDYLNDETSVYCGMRPDTMEAAYATFLSMTDGEKSGMRQAGFAMCKKLTTDSAAEQLGDVFAELLS